MRKGNKRREKERWEDKKTGCGLKDGRTEEIREEEKRYRDKGLWKET